MLKKEIFISSIIILVIALFSSYFYIKNNNNSTKELKVFNMNNKEKIFSYISNTEDYIPKYREMYEQINYHNEENYNKEINVLLNLNYTPLEINNIYDFIKRNNIKKLLTAEKLDLTNYYNITNFEVDKINRYEEYVNLHNCSLDEAVLKVNIGLDHDFYTQIESIQNNNDYTILVNKYHYLGDYEPSDLKSLSYDKKYQLREKARDAFEELVSSAKLENVFIRPYSAYRSYKYQQSLYNTYVNRDGEKNADTYSARPGHSEHQTGLAVDVWSEGYNELLNNDAIWLKENSYKYGFIIRYTKENENITGYIEEPWHLRYLGIDIATDVYEKNLTYDEYYDLYIK